MVVAMMRQKCKGGVAMTRQKRKTLEFLGGIVGLDGAGLDDDGGVAFLPCLRAGGDATRDVAGTQSQPRRERRQRRNEHRDDDFQDFFTCHSRLLS